MDKSVKSKQIVFLLAFFGLIVLCPLLPWPSLESGFPRSPGTYLNDYAGHDYGYFLIEPETILSSLRNGKTIVFLPETRNDVDKYTRSDPILFRFTEPWYQADYMKIVDALNQVSFHDDLEDWDLYRAIFYANCDEDFAGFTYASLTFFRSNSLWGPYETRLFNINPQQRSVEWGGGATFSKEYPLWKTTELNDIISAEDALEIADENGGLNARLDTECWIYVMLFPSSEDGWYVSYGDIYMLDMNIDAHTGKIIK